MTAKCFACDRKLGRNPYVADTRDAQFVYVGSECFRLIKAAGDAGFQPLKGGPRLFLIPRSTTNAEADAMHVSAREAAKSKA